MKIIALKYYENGYMQQAFAFGGSRPKEKLDLEKTYPASLQNFLIDTGSEVILIDTGMPGDSPIYEKKPDLKLFMGEKIENFTDALATAGYKPEDIDKVVITHKHPDHSGEIGLFSHAKVFISETEAVNMKLDAPNIVKVTFTDGPYKNFASSQKIAENLYMLPACGHTHGNSIAILELDGLNYMFQGDVTYTDEALKENELSVVFEDIEKAKQTLATVRTFIKENETIYLSTHTPTGVTSLANKLIMKL